MVVEVELGESVGVFEGVTVLLPEEEEVFDDEDEEE